MKKLLSLLLAICCILSCATAFTACGGNTTPPSESSPNSTPTHTHNYSQAWSHDQMGHWIACNGENLGECDNPTKDYGNHNYSNGACTVCGRSQGHTCEYGDFVYDSKHHWKECSECDATTSKIGHTFSGKVCTACGYNQGGSSTNTHTVRDLEIITSIAGIGTVTLVKLPDGKDMLIDSGDGYYEGNFFVEDLLYGNVTDGTIEYFVLTNTEPWRTGGASNIFYDYTVLNFYRPDVKSSHTMVAHLSSPYNSGNSPYVDDTEDYAIALEAADAETGCSVKVVDETSCDIDYTFQDSEGNTYNYKIDFMTPIAASNRDSLLDNSVMVSIEYNGITTLITSDIGNDLIDAYCNTYGNAKDMDVLITTYLNTDEAMHAISGSDSRGTNFLKKINLTEGDYSIVIPINSYDEVGELIEILANYSTVYSIEYYWIVTAKVTSAGILSITAE